MYVIKHGLKCETYAYINIYDYYMEDIYKYICLDVKYIYVSVCVCVSVGERRKGKKKSH